VQCHPESPNGDESSSRCQLLITPQTIFDLQKRYLNAV
jgi:hypothetical protein